MVTSFHVACVSISGCVRKKRGCRIGAIGQDSLAIRAIIIVLATLNDFGAIESEVTLAELRVEEIIGHGRVVSSVHILPRTGEQFTPDVELDIEIYVRIYIRRYKKIAHRFDPRERYFCTLSQYPGHRNLNGSVRQDVELATYGRYFRCRRDVIE